MKVYTIAQQKGGVGKTVVAADLVWHLAQQGLRVLAIDGDPQHTLSTRLGWTPDMDTPGFTSDVYIGRMSAEEAAMPSPTVPGADVLVSDPDLGDVDNDPAYARRWMDYLPTLTRWDAVVIDTAPNTKLGTCAAVAAADVLTVPAKCAGESTDAMSDFVTLVLPVAEALRPGRQIHHVVPMEYAERENVSRSEVASLTAAFGEHVTVPVRRSTVVPQSYDHAKPVSGYRRSAPVARDLQAVCATIAAHEVPRKDHR